MPPKKGAKKDGKPAPKKVEATAAGADAKKEDAPAKAVMKAKKVMKKVVKGPNGTKVRRVRTSVHFFNKPPQRLPRRPKYPR